MNYEEMLARAKQQLPEDAENKERFVIPKVTGHIEGNKTIVSNFGQIADILRRPKQHLLKYVQKEMATPGDLRGNAVIFLTKLAAGKINEKITQYADEFVICKECSRPDTKLTKEGSTYIMLCQACGARHSFVGKV
ncbi:MAG: translation initiation factor IF-2 subunit beta [archaeon]